MRVETLLFGALSRAVPSHSLLTAHSFFPLPVLCLFVVRLASLFLSFSPPFWSLFPPLEDVLELPRDLPKVSGAVASAWKLLRKRKERWGLVYCYKASRGKLAGHCCRDVMSSKGQALLVFRRAFLLSCSISLRFVRPFFWKVLTP